MLLIVLLSAPIAVACGEPAIPGETDAALTGFATSTPLLVGPDQDPSELTNEPGGSFDGSIVPAPIESVTIERVAAKPPNASLIVVSGLRSGCESFGGHSLEVVGDVI